MKGMRAKSDGQMVSVGRSIYPWIFATLFLGFIVSIAIPKIAISRVGSEEYGRFALIVGFAGALAFADLGLVPGITTGIATLFAKRRYWWIKTILRQIFFLSASTCFALFIICALVMAVWNSRFDEQDTYLLLLFSIATTLCTIADVNCAMLRAAGEVRTSYVLRCLYLAVYLASVVSAHQTSQSWNGVAILFFCQLIASVAYLAFSTYMLLRSMRGSSQVPKVVINKVRNAAFWLRAWRTSVPERRNKLVQLLISATERPLLVATAGLAMVGSYDLLMRLALLVTAIPGAVNQPLLAMLAHDQARPPGEQRYGKALQHTRSITLFSSGVGVVLALVLWRYGHVVLFGVESIVPLALAFTIILATGINVLTAPGTAELLSKGIVWPCTYKLWIELVGSAVAAGSALWVRDGLIFIEIRNASIAASAAFFLLVLTNLRKRSS
jgi:hypothetical protein